MRTSQLRGYEDAEFTALRWPHSMWPVFLKGHSGCKFFLDYQEWMTFSVARKKRPAFRKPFSRVIVNKIALRLTNDVSIAFGCGSSGVRNCGEL
jgi:hypothetical protein